MTSRIDEMPRPPWLVFAALLVTLKDNLKVALFFNMLWIVAAPSATELDPFDDRFRAGPSTSSRQATNRQGAPELRSYPRWGASIDLIDGAELAEKLKELGLGVRREVVEVFKVDDKWFENF